MVYLVSALFLLTPIALTIHLSVSRSQSGSYKARVAAIYGGIWAIALLYYFWLLNNS